MALILDVISFCYWTVVSVVVHEAFGHALICWTWLTDCPGVDINIDNIDSENDSIEIYNFMQKCIQHFGTLNLIKAQKSLQNDMVDDNIHINWFIWFSR